MLPVNSQGEEVLPGKVGLTIRSTSGAGVIDKLRDAISNAISIFSNHPCVAKIIRSVTSMIIHFKIQISIL